MDELGFAELQAHVPDISSKVLADSLRDLEENGLVEREIINEQPFRVNYSLTAQGQSLEPLISEMNEWGTQYLERVGPPPGNT